MVTIIKNVSSLNKGFINTLRIKSQKILELMNAAQSDITIVIDSNNKLRELNNLYLGIDETTDVLSFESGEIDPDTGRKYLGDIIISLEKAREQAVDNNHSLPLEILTLVVHGVLHLLNYDHTDKAKAKIMFDKQTNILEEINIL